MRPGTYFTSISTSSPFSSVALRYLYLVFLAWYLRTSPSAFNILPTVRSWSSTPSFSSFQCSLSAQTFFSLRSSMTRSLSRIGVSLGEVLGLVDLHTNPATPFFLYAATHRSRVRLPYGHILAASTTLTSFCAMGNTHRSRSSKISFAILTISGCYPKTAICLCTLPRTLDGLTNTLFRYIIKGGNLGSELKLITGFISLLR